ncbi:MAG: ATP-binding protein [Deltaproteobacteria bacterium]|nr:ATP-binding protein [Deltaproteobacteria bacterium]
MNFTRRYLTDQVIADLSRKMVFLGGPRQVGKTTLSKQIAPLEDYDYLNWDADDDRDRILRKEFSSKSLWIFDELHKYRLWRRYLKGLYDKRSSGQKILVTGSARLDYYRFGGDSLQGRYHYLRLHPLSVAELNSGESADVAADLMKLGGFPEPFFSGSETELKRWTIENRTRLVRQDLIDLEKVSDVGRLELLMLRLPELVGSPLSVNSLRENLEVSHKTLSHWLDILERLYAIFRIAPFGADRIRAVKKARKHYHMNWTVVKAEGPRFENLVASHLLKWVHYQEDCFGKEWELRYFRDVDLREVDFVITEENKPILMVEAKLEDSPVTEGLKYLKTRFRNADAYQISLKGNKDYVTADGIRVCPATAFLRTLV